MLTYEKQPVHVKVKLDGKYIGDIKEVANGFQYFPKGKKVGGEVFHTLALCKESLECPDD